MRVDEQKQHNGQRNSCRGVRLPGMMDTVRLRRHQNIAQRAHIGTHVGMIETRVPAAENGIKNDGRRAHLQHQEWDGQKHFTHNILQHVIAEVGEKFSSFCE